MVAVSLVLGCLVLVSLQSVASVPLPLFIPFGPDSGDNELDQGNDVSASVTLQQPIPFLGLNRDSVTVETDGTLSLASAASVYVFSADVDTTSIGHVFYRESREPDVLSRVNELANMGFPGSVNVTYAFIATWFYVGYFDNHDDLTNTFQCVLATDGERSFAVLLYADNLIQWMTGDSDGGVNGFGGDRADVGFIGDDASNVFFLPASNTSAVLDLDATTNVGFGGVWIFELGNSTVDSAIVDECALGLNNCDPNAECLDLAQSFACECLPGFTGDGLSCSGVDGASGSGGFISGFISGSGSGSGAPLTDFCRGTFDGCCVESSNTSSDCVVSVDLDNCSCSQDCFELGNCCSDILIASCFPEITVSFSALETSVAESESVVSVSVDISGYFPDPLIVQPGLSSYFVFYTRDGTAEAPGDYDGTIQVVEFSEAGPQLIQVAINDDQLVEGAEFLTAFITAGDSFVRVGLQETTVSIVDDDFVTISVEQPSYTVSEAEGRVEVCAVVTQGQLDQFVSAQLSTMDGTALAGSDYSSVDIAFLFSDSTSRQCVNITIIADGVVEPDETFSVNLETSSSDVMLNVSMATVTITNSDRVTISVKQPSYTVSETEGRVEVCAVVTQGQLDQFVSVQLSTMDGTALAGSDYSSVDIAFSFSASTSRQCVNITIIADGVVESDETFSVNLETSSSDVMLNVSMATVTITDSDRVTISVEQPSYTVSEAEGRVEVCAVVTQGQLDQFVSAQLSTMDGTALAGSDYSSADIAFVFSDSTSRQCVNITIIADGVVEPDETFSVNLETSSSDITLSVSMATVTISDSDRVTISVEQPSYTVSEAEGRVEVCAVVTQGQLDQFVSAQLSTMDGTALAGSDYSSVDIAFVFSDSNSRQCVNVTIIADGVVESDEAFSVNLDTSSSDVMLNVSMATVTITDSDRVTISVEQPSYTVSEAEGRVEVCAVVTQGQLDQFVSAQLSTMDGTALAGSDYSSVGIAFVFSDSTSRQCVNITIIADGVVESDETFSVNLETSSSDVMLGVSMATVRITDSDRVTISVEQPSYTVGEAEGRVEVCAVVTQGQLDQFVSVSVQLSTMDGTALGGLDYSSVNSFLSFSASTSRQCVNITIIADGVVEPDEIFSVNLDTSSSDVILNISMTTVTITNSDRVTISVEQPSYTVSEAEGRVEVCAVVTQGQLDQFVSAQLSTMDGTALAGSDYSSVDIAFVFSDSTSRQCVNITIIADGVVESDETFSVNLEISSSDITLSVSMATVTISDSDRVTISVEQPSYTVSEAEGRVEVCAVVTQGQLDQFVSAQLSTMDGTALAGSDYSSVDIAFVFSDSNSRQCVNITIIADGVVESDEAFSVNLDTSSSDVMLNVSMATVTITDSDRVTISVEQPSYTVSEAEGRVEVCAIVTQGQLDQFVSVSVQLSTMDGTAFGGLDYSSVNSFLSFSASTSRQCVNITIIADGVVEPDETFSVNLETSSSDVVLNDSRASVTIVNSDRVTISVEQPSYTVSETEGRVEVCAVVIQGQLDQFVSAQLSTMDGTALAGSDYSSVDIAFVFAPSTSRQCVNITIIADSVVEPDETFSVNLETSSSDVVTFGVSMATVTITDIDRVTISVEQPSYTVGEAEGRVEVCAVVTQGQLDQFVSVSVQLSTMDGTALGGLDYSSVNSFLSFSASTSRQCVNITIIADGVVESDEIFSVNLETSSSDVILNVSMTTVTITDSDRVTISVEQPSYTVSETEGRVEVCAVVTQGQLDQFVSVQLSTMDGTALAGSDYSSLGIAFVFSDSTSRQCVNITIIADGVVESDETFSVNLETSSSDVMLGVSMATVRIIDSDRVTISVEQPSYTVSEAEGRVEVCAVVTQGQLDQFVSVQLSTMDGTALAGSDYSSVDIAFVFAPSTSRQCVNITIIADGVVEPDETFSVNLISPSTDDIALGRSMATVTITNIDRVTISVEQPSYTVSEAEGRVEVCAVVTQGQLDQFVSVSVQLSTMDGTALGGLDYSSVNSFLSFSASTSRQCVNITIIADGVVEATEVFGVVLTSTDSGVIFATRQADVAITDSDVVGVSFAQSSYPVPEGSGVSVEVCLHVSGSALDRSVTVGVATGEIQSAQATVDFTPDAFSVTFDQSPSEMCVNIEILDDSETESDESFSVVLQGPAPQGVSFLSPSVTTVIIQDDDGVMNDCSFRFIQDTFSGNEDAGFFPICVELNGVTTTTTSVLFTTTDGTAIAGSDYIGFPNMEQVNFNPSPFGIAVICPRVQFIDDALAEPSETFFVTLSAPQGGCSIATPSTTVTIIDLPSDGVGISFERQVYVIEEAGGSVELCVVLTVAPTAGQTLSVNYETVNGTALADEDFSDRVGVFSFASSSPLRQCVSIVILDDLIFESDETFSVVLSQPSPGLVITQSTATVSITDNDPRPVTISLEQATYTVSEEGGSVMVCLVVSEGAVQSPTPITVSTTDGSATAGSGGDYTAVERVLTFLPGGSERMCVSITILDDTEQEGAESFTVSLSSDSFPGTLGDPAIVTITDTLDGTLMVTFDQLSYTFAEDEDPALVVVCVDLMDNAVNRVVDILLTLRDGSARAGEDYVAETAIIRFDPVNAQAVICERVALIDDLVNEPTEMFFADLTTSDSAVVFQDRTTAITILDNDPAVSVGFSSPSFSILEGESPPSLPSVVRACVDISGSFSGQLSFTVSTTPGTALDGVDYVGGDVPLIFTAGGPTTQCATYTIVGDNTVEPTEQFTVSLLSVGGQSAVALSPSSATVVIVDDDVASEIVLINDTPAVIQDNATSASVRVDFSLSPDTDSASCQLVDVFGARDCSGGTVTFSGLDPQRREPFTFIVTAFNAQGEVLANITRQVRLGLNTDCSVVFVNAGEEDVVVIDGFGFVRVEWEEVGLIDFTDCRLEVNEVVGEYEICTSPYLLGNLAPGSYSVKVRPNGAACGRRIRRTVMFTVE